MYEIVESIVIWSMLLCIVFLIVEAYYQKDSMRRMEFLLRSYEKGSPGEMGTRLKEIFKAIVKEETRRYQYAVHDTNRNTEEIETLQKEIRDIKMILEYGRNINVKIGE